MSHPQIIDVPAELHIDRPTYCHVFPRENGLPGLRAYCGVPRSEQPRHGSIRLPGHPLSTDPYCASCGAPRCPTCAAGSIRRAREYGL